MHFSLLPTDFYPLNNFLAIVYLVLHEIKATKNVPQIHNIPVGYNREQGRVPAGCTGQRLKRETQLQYQVLKNNLIFDG